MRAPWIIFVVVTALVVSLGVLGLMRVAPGGEAAVGMEGRPALHAAMNGTSAVLLSLGFVMIRTRRIRAHMACMVLAAVVSIGFLASYLQYHAQAGSTPFAGQGPIRPVYFTLLLTHTVLAALVAPIAISLFWFAARGRLEQHRRIARWGLPMWLYVSITGVLIYFMLYVWFPSG